MEAKRPYALMCVFARGFLAATSQENRYTGQRLHNPLFPVK